MRYSTALAMVSLLFSGCMNHADISPSQNPSLEAVSPSATAGSSGGIMQQSLDNWLKEEWAPLTQSAPATTTTTQSDGTVVTTKTEASRVVTTSTAPDGKVTTTSVPVTQEPKDDTPFTLQKYADKWKLYHENKAKMNEGKPKEVSNIEKLEQMPIIGKKP